MMKRLFLGFCIVVLAFGGVACGFVPDSASGSESGTEKEVPEVYVGSGDVFYVNPSADENGDGTPLSPFRTIEEAYRAAVRSLCRGETADAVIYLCRGTHRVESEFVIRGTDLPARDFSLTFAGNPDGGSVVTDTVDIPASAFRAADGGCYYVYAFPDAARDENGDFPAFRNIFLNGEYLTPARTESLRCPVDSVANAGAHPKDTGIAEKNHLIYVPASQVYGVVTDGDGYFVETLPDGSAATDKDGKVIRKVVECHVTTEWMVHTIRADRALPMTDMIDTDTREYLVPLHIVDADWALFRDGYHATDLHNTDCRYFLQEHLSFLDTPGEFYYDRGNGLLYVYPEGRLYPSDVISYATTGRIFSLYDAGNITFQNLTIYGTTVNYVTDNGFVCGQGGVSKRREANGRSLGFLPYGVFYGVNVHDITLDTCVVRDTGSDGVNFSGAVEHITVSNCEFYRIGGSAVRFGQNTNAYNNTIYTRHITVNNNYVDTVGLDFPSNPAIIVTSVLDMAITGNTIRNIPYSAISIGYSWVGHFDDSDYYNTAAFVNVKNVTVTQNYIENFMLSTSDGAAIYTLGGNANGKYTDFLNDVAYNYIAVSPEVSGQGRNIWAVIYGDQGSSHWHYHDNVVVFGEGVEKRNQYAVMFNMGAGYMGAHNTVERQYCLYEPGGVSLGEVDPPYQWTTTVYQVILRDFYVYANLDEMPYDLFDNAKEIYENAGSTLYPKPLAFAEKPE